MNGMFSSFACWKQFVCKIERVVCVRLKFFKVASSSAVLNNNNNNLSINKD